MTFSVMIFIVLFLAGCAGIPVGDTSRNALDWPGTYKSDDISITLRENMTYRAQVGNVEVRSTFRWNSKGQAIVLQNFKAYAPFKKLLVGENILIPLKNSGKPLKDAVVLIKTGASDQTMVPR